MSEENLDTTANTKNECKTKSNKNSWIKTKKKPKLEIERKDAKKPKRTLRNFFKKIKNLKKNLKKKFNNKRQKVNTTDLTNEEGMVIPTDIESVNKVLSQVPSLKSIQLDATNDDVNVEEQNEGFIKEQNSAEVRSLSNQENVNWSSDKEIKKDNTSEIQECCDNDIQNSQTSKQTKESATEKLSSEIIKIKIIEEPTQKKAKNNLNKIDFTNKNIFYKEYMNLLNNYSSKKSRSPENTTLNENTFSRTENIDTTEIKSNNVITNNKNKYFCGEIRNIDIIENVETIQIKQEKDTNLYCENILFSKDLKSISVCSDSKEKEPKNVENIETIKNITPIKTILTDIPEIQISEEIGNILQPIKTPNYHYYTESNDNLNMDEDVFQNKQEICTKETEDNLKISVKSRFFTPKPFRKPSKSGTIY